jgi:hypothetical protein
MKSLLPHLKVGEIVAQSCPCPNTGSGCPCCFNGPGCDTLIDCLSYERYLLANNTFVANAPCQNGGLCNVTNGECVCGPWYNGSTCQYVINFCTPSSCSYHGTCSPVPGSVKCACDAGYQGSDCSSIVDTCSPNPCANGGTCQQPGVNQYNCTCASGFTGPTCQSIINLCTATSCSGHGQCIPEPNSHQCICIDGWTGANCDIRKPRAGSVSYSAACPANCSQCNEAACLQCTNGTYLYNGQCLPTCPAGFVADPYAMAPYNGLMQGFYTGRVCGGMTSSPPQISRSCVRPG